MIKILEEVKLNDESFKKASDRGDFYQLYATVHGETHKVYSSFETCKELALRCICRAEMGHKDVKLGIMLGEGILKREMRMNEFSKAIDDISKALKIKAPNMYYGKNVPNILFIEFNGWKKNAILMGTLLYFSRVFLTINEAATPKKYIAYFKKGRTDSRLLLDDRHTWKAEDIHIEENMENIEPVLRVLKFLKLYGSKILPAASKRIVRDSFEAGPIEFGYWLENLENTRDIDDNFFDFHKMFSKKFANKFYLNSNDDNMFDEDGEIKEEALKAREQFKKTLHNVKVDYDRCWV